jgi:hypothetical protein
MIASVSQVVLTEFWAGLTEIAALGALPAAWLTAVPVNHPFLHPDITQTNWVVSAYE